QRPSGRDRNRPLTTLSTVAGDLVREGGGAGRVERARLVRLHARRAGGDAEGGRPRERLAALERDAEAADERIARPDRVADRDARRAQPRDAAAALGPRGARGRRRDDRPARAAGDERLPRPARPAAGLLG